jgi:hypothetical protein
MTLRYRLSVPILIMIGALLVAQTLYAWHPPTAHARDLARPLPAAAPQAGDDTVRQQAPLLTATPTSTATPTKTPYPCPTGTPEPLWVDPVISPTSLLTQTIAIYAGNALTVTVSSEAGNVKQTSGSTWPARITINLVPETTHHLTVTAQIPLRIVNGCPFGGYSLQTTRDKFGQLLTIVQSGGAPATATPTVTATAVVSQETWRIYLPALVK